MAFSMEANVYVATYAVWSDPVDDERVQRWVTERYRALEPVSKGTYLGDADLLNRPAPFMAPTTSADSPRSATSTTRTGASPAFG